MKLHVIKEGISQGWREYPLKTKTLIRIGSEDSSTLVLEGLEKTHALIEKTSDEYWVSSIKHGAVVLVNGEHVLHKKLTHGDEIALGPYCLRVSLEAELPIESDMDTRHRHHNTFVSLCNEIAQDPDWSAIVRRRKQQWQTGTDAVKREVLRKSVQDARDLRMGKNVVRDTGKVLSDSIAKASDEAYLRKIFSLSKEEARDQAVDLLIETQQLQGTIEGRVVQAMQQDMRKNDYPEAEQGLLLVLPILMQMYADKLLELGLLLSRAGGLTYAKYVTKMEKATAKTDTRITEKLRELNLLDKNEEPTPERLMQILKQFSQQR